MNSTARAAPQKFLPSADWVAFGLGLLALLFSPFSQTLRASWGLAVFAPFILRELGVLKDSDEWLRGIMHRAGFHAALAMLSFVFLNRLLPGVSGPWPAELLEGGHLFGMEFLWLILVLVFMTSYLIQYWGAARGVARVLLGLGLVMVVNLAMSLMRMGTLPRNGPLALGVVALLLLLAWVATRWPVPAGGLLLCTGLGLLVLNILVVKTDPAEATAWVLSTQLPVLLFCGMTGGSLVRVKPEEREA